MAKHVCKHTSLYLDVSPHASKAGFKRPNRRRRISAATRGRRALKEVELLTSKELLEDEMAFPGPLVLPGDDLAEDPEYPPQDFNEWRDEEERNPVTKERKTIYIMPSPWVESSVSKMQTWSVCNSSAKEQDAQAVCSPDIQDIAEYLSAFFYGMDVKVLKQTFCWQKWNNYDGTVLKSSSMEKRIGLRSPSGELFGIRCRASPDGVSCMQINLNDVLDALAENIPSDAHSIMIMLDQDMYEGDGDIFCAGRAYGGSRIAAVSTFRDQPSCAPEDNGHAWPASHCAAYINQLCHLESFTTKPQPVQRKPNSGPLHAAIKATTSSVRHESGSSIPSEAPAAQWLGRVAVTMAHELCHCLGLDHCVYFACAMQGCGSVEEAQRQPPYVCPVCLEKLAAAIGEGAVSRWNDDVWSMEVRQKYVRDRYKALRRVCERWGNPSISRMFAGYGAWLDVVVERSL
ncbi:hypothetical protein ACQKWADRAFT_295584 [Trichoderma austrokoningii]